MTTNGEQNGRKKMDTERHQQKRRTARSIRRPRREKDSKGNVKESRAQQKLANAQACSASRNIRQAVQEKIDVKVNYIPLRERFLTLANYATLLEQLDKSNKSPHLANILILLDGLKKDCQIFLNYELLKEGKRHGKYGN